MKTFITILLLGTSAIFVPAYAQTAVEIEVVATSTDPNTSTTTATTTLVTKEETEELSPLQKFTLCSQQAIEQRDGSITSSRATYNSMMTLALTARKDAEISALSEADESKNKDILKTAAESYKKGVEKAQEDLSKARKEAWSQFESQVKHCRDIRDGKAKPKTEVINKSSSVVEPNNEKAVEPEAKTLGESIKDTVSAIINFFRRVTD